MDQTSITRSIVENLVDQYLEQIKRDPKRSIRKLVDLGGQFAKGRFQKRTISLMQAVLSNEKSPYYTFVREITEHTASEKIKTFGINVGFNSWTVGAKVIRAKEAELGFNIPWALTFHVNDKNGVLSPSEMRRLIREGKECGIYAYLLRFSACDGNTGVLEECNALVRENPDCAFAYFLPPKWVSESAAEEMYKFRNLMLSADVNSGGWEKVLKNWKERRALFAVHRAVSSYEDADELVSGAWMERIIPSGALFAFCFIELSCPPESRKAVEAYLSQIRSEQKYPAFPMDYYADHLMIDQIISDGPCYMGILPDGTVTMYDGLTERPTKQTVCDRSLLSVLEKHPLKEE